MSRALKRVAPCRLNEGQEAFPLLYGSKAVPASDTPATEIAAAAKSSQSTFYDAGGRFVPRCACGAYGTFWCRGELAARAGRDVVVRPVLAHARRQQGARIMTEQAVNSRLGRGLAALIGDDDEPAPERRPGQRKVPVASLRPNPRNPRKHFKADEIEALAGSIRQR